jgi:iron(II)-dependent oxidoreductase
VTTDHDLKETIATSLEGGRLRTLGLVEPFTEEELLRSPSRLMSPLVWDLGHCANYEELWLLRNVAGMPATDPKLDDIYNAFEHPRWERPNLPLLQPKEARAYLNDIRGKSLDVLERVELTTEQRLLARGYVYGMVVQHEHMHDETMLATIQLMQRAYPSAAPPPKAAARGLPEMVLVDGGPFEMGTSVEPWAFDNERPGHTVVLPPFWIDTAPVTNEQYMRFIDEGGYDDPRHWTEGGWAWRQEAKGSDRPEFWERDGASWVVRKFGRASSIAPDEPVQHVSYHEATAFAHWAGKRLPTEEEWEKAASWGPAGGSGVSPGANGRKRRFPWGDEEPTELHANIDQRHFGPAPVGAYPEGASAYGCHQMIGDVWEWTSSDFQPYPGYEWFPYREYSEVFYGADYKVLRGGSWATHATSVRSTFRNWDYPIRRQIFCGFRCARDGTQ